jgi:hypothetical protein
MDRVQQRAQAGTRDRTYEALRRYVRAFIEEGKVAASPAYMKKERVRSELQGIIERLIADGDLTSQEELDEFFETLTMASRALKSVPVEAFLRSRR